MHIHVVDSSLTKIKLLREYLGKHEISGSNFDRLNFYGVQFDAKVQFCATLSSQHLIGIKEQALRRQIPIPASFWCSGALVRAT